MTDERHIIDHEFCKRFARNVAKKYSGEFKVVLQGNTARGYATYLTVNGNVQGPWITMGNTYDDQKATVGKLNAALAAYAEG